MGYSVALGAHPPKYGLEVMMGHINNLVVEMVRDNLGDDTVLEMFDTAGIAPRFYKPEVIYSDDEFQALFKGAQRVFDVDSEAAEEAFAEYFMQVSPEMFPAIFTQAGCAKELFEKIPIIHQSFPAAASQSDYVDKVVITESSHDRVVFEYDSPNRLCITLRRLAQLVLAYYGEQGIVTEIGCQKSGSPHCQVIVTFNRDHEQE